MSICRSASYLRSTDERHTLTHLGESADHYDIDVRLRQSEETAAAGTAAWQHSARRRATEWAGLRGAALPHAQDAHPGLGQGRRGYMSPALLVNESINGRERKREKGTAVTECATLETGSRAAVASARGDERIPTLEREGGGHARSSGSERRAGRFRCCREPRAHSVARPPQARYV